MAKYYGVKEGVRIGVFESWDEVKPLVNGYPGAEYKSFPTKPEAEEYVFGTVPTYTSKVEPKPAEPPKNFKTDCEMVAYTDGSYNDRNNRSGYGIVIVNPKGETIETIQGSVSAKSRQIDGELFAALTAIMYAIKKGVKSIEIRYDYEGIGKWASGEWSAIEDCSIEYKRAVRNLKSFVDVKFTKVPAHSGVRFNELADGLAKKGCGM